jgi:hypothetical protein
MTIKAIIEYNSPVGFDYDPTQINIEAGGAYLRPQPIFGAIFQNFLNDSGFTYDSALLQFTASTVEQISQKPADATFGASYNSSLNASWGDGILTSIATSGSPAITGQKLDLTVPNSNVTYNSTDMYRADQGAIKFKYTPQESGYPTNTQQWFLAEGPGPAENRLVLQHDSSGQIRLQHYTSAGASLGDNFFGSWSPTSGQEYELELNYDYTLGEQRLFIDGIQQGTTAIRTGARSNLASSTTFRMGGSVNSNMILDDFLMFSEVKHTANYTPGYAVADNEYTEALLIVPPVPLVQGLIDYTSFLSTSFNGTPRFVFQDQYWNGSAWVPSDNSYAQATSYADAVSNIASLDVFGETEARVSIVFPSAPIKSTIGNYTIERNIAGSFYPESTIVPLTPLTMNVLEGLVETSTKLGADDIRYYVLVNDIAYWYDGITWAAIVGSPTSVTSNSAAEVLDNAGSLPISTGANVKIGVILVSATGSTTPTMQTLEVEYTFGIVEACVPIKCAVYGCILDSIGDPIPGAKITVDGSDYFYTESDLSPGADKVALITRSATTFSNSEGEWSLPVVETVTDGTTVNFTIEYKQNGKVIKKTYTGITVPQQVAVPLGNLVNP